MSLPGSGFLYCREAVAHRLKSPPPPQESLHYPDDGGAEGGRFLTGRPDPLSVVSMTESMGLIDSLTRDAIDRHTTSLAAHTLDIAKERGYEPVTALGEHGPIATFKSKSDPGTALAFINKMRTEDHIALETHRDRSDHAFIRMSFHCYNEEAEIARAFDALDKMK
jgi:selenocysteine lyase/cysteine desulfurase